MQCTCWAAAPRVSVWQDPAESPDVGHAKQKPGLQEEATGARAQAGVVTS